MVKWLTRLIQIAASRYASNTVSDVEILFEQYS